MNPVFSFEFDWLQGECGSDVNRCTAAEGGLRVGDAYLTELEDLRAKTVRQRMRVSANDLALWLTDNWWRLRWEAERSGVHWRMSHCVAAAGGGHVWPNLSFCGDGEAMHLQLDVSASCDFPVRYLRNIKKTIAVRDFVSGVDSFIESVIDRLREYHIGDAELIELWREVQRERHDPVLASYRKMEALLGFDADECSDKLMRTLDALSKNHGRGAVEEIASAHGTNAPSVINALETGEKSQAQPITIPASKKMQTEIRRQQQKIWLPWELAGVVAKQVRGEWGIAPEAPISTIEFAGIVGTPPVLLETADVPADTPISSGFRSGVAPDAISVLLDKKWATSRRFALARIIGDHFYSQSEDHILPTTSSKTVRQKFQRAFAQELLCPFEALVSTVGDHVSDDDAIQDAAALFEVSPQLVTTTLVNRGMLDRNILR